MVFKLFVVKKYQPIMSSNLQTFSSRCFNTENKVCYSKEGRGVILDLRTYEVVVLYDFISTDIYSSDYDDEITAFTITGLRIVRKENSQHQRMEYNHVPLICMPLEYLLRKLFTTTITTWNSQA